MTTPLHVLIVEDDEDDAHLTVRELRKGCFDVSWHRVDTRPAMERALADGVWDLVICDHAMPAFSSGQALDVMRGRGLDIPFIVVSGVAPEDLVTAAMRAGAHDFISKSGLVRLVPAVQRELREATIRRERAQMASRLTESENRYANLFRENPAPMLLVEASTLMVVDVNPAAASFFGHSLEALKQATVHGLGGSGRIAEWKAVQEGPEPKGRLFQDQLIIADGQTRDVDVYAVRVVQAGRSCVLATLFDQTDRRTAERLLAESEARFRSLADSTPMLVWTTGPDGSCTYLNRTWLEFRGRSLEEETTQGWLDAIHPEDRDWFAKIRAEAFRRRIPFETEFRILRWDGQFRWILDKGLPRLTREAEFMGFIGSGLDITDRKAAEESRTLLAATIEQVVDAVAITDTDGMIEYANGAFQAVTGIPVQEAAGWNLGDLLEQAEIHKALGEAARGIPWNGRLRFGIRSGKDLSIDAVCSPVRDPGGSVAHLVMVMRDVTKEAELERELRQAQKMEALGSLAAGIAHDFNNILTTILTSAELIKWKLPPESPLASRVDVILQAGLCAAGLNKQILSFSRKSDEKRIPMDLSASAREALQMLKAALPANVEVRSDLTSGIWVEGDPAQLQQIILNLAINGFQAMQPGGGLLEIALAETRLDEQSASGVAPGRYALLTVRDTGCGMDGATLERIFDPFFTTKPQEEGTGLGLSVVHASVSKARGKIAVSSAPGKGTEFRIHWPCVTGDERPAGDRLPEDVSGSESILFVDDEELVAALAKLGLQNLGYSVTTCSDPVQALERFAADPGAYDLVFTDLAMPQLNGVDLACRIHEIRRQVPVLLVSGLPLAAALSLNSQARFQGMVAKPFTAFDLADAARKVLGQLAAADEPEPSPRAKLREGAILLAEDSHVTRTMIRTWLERQGCEVVEAKDGQEAWELFNHESHRGRFALVLTDIVMPRMDGLELTRLLRRADPSLPVAVLTTNEDKETVKSALNLGVNEFLNKPFDASGLMECVERMLALRYSRMTARRSAETAQAVRLAQKSLVAVPEKDMPFFSICEPLTDAGGDVFKCMECADGSILFFLADVAGHSVVSSYAVAAFLGTLSSYVCDCAALMALPALAGPSAADMPMLRYACGNYGKYPCNPLRHLIMKFNLGIQSGPFSEVPICVLMGLWNPATGQLRLVNAGIPHGLVAGREKGSTQPIELNGTPLGIFPEPMADECTLQLQPGDRVLFGTDGFFDALSEAKRPFQEVAPERWDELRESPLDWALGAICEEARNHGGGVIADDLLVVGFEQPSLSREPEDLVLKLPSSARAVDVACDRVSECLRTVEPPLDEGRAFDIELAVREALTNALFHGNRNRPEAFITLRCVRGPSSGSLTVSVEDEGPGFDLEAHVPPGDPLSERGRGIPLIRYCAGSIRMDGGRLTMTFQLQESSHDDCEITTAR